MTEPLTLQMTTRSTNRITILDLVLRLITLVIYLEGLIGSIPFIITHILISIAIIIITIYLDRKLKARLEKKINLRYKNAFQHFRLSNDSPDWVRTLYLISGGAAALFVFLHFRSLSHWYDYAILLALTILFLACARIFSELAASASIYPEVSSYRVLQHTAKDGWADLSAQYPDVIALSGENTSMVHLTEDLANDIRIGRLDSDLKGIITTVEAYMLESVLLGGLSFSAFVAVVASSYGKNVDTKFQLLIHSIWPLKHFSHLDTTGLARIVGSFSLEENLYPLIMFECRICSVFFLLVLTLRLRFTSLSLKMDHLVRILVSFNAKEEELVNLQFSVAETRSPSLESRMGVISAKINETLSDANDLMTQLVPIMGIMSLFRNLGIIFFYIVLITAGMYFSPILSGFILMIAICTVLFRWIEGRMKVRKLKEILMKH